MTDKEWEEYKRLADKGESQDVKTRDILDLLHQRDELKKALKFKLAVNHAHSCFCARCEKARAALQAASK